LSSISRRSSSALVSVSGAKGEAAGDMDRGPERRQPAIESDRVRKRLLVEFGEKLAFVHTVVVVHQYRGDLAGDPGSNERHMAVDVGVVRRNGVERFEDPRDAEYADDRQN